jgi:hypothetical protein
MAPAAHAARPCLRATAPTVRHNRFSMRHRHRPADYDLYFIYDSVLNYSLF